ncbi:MAG: ribonuclease D [Woeseiaceae bacterium]|nr:ribonuclease D [Woeseiaceae bacterium]NIP21262.1 ribonuclease D [Woeseiaceae bacterium]NIS90234.1 ribonuclease D [Woeseiaceae bacterium]
MPDYQLVETPDSIVSDLGRHEYVGVDTEFMREKTFFAELCLVQVSTGDNIYCVDPLAGNAMTFFWDALIRDTWVVHSARQDIEVIYQTAQRMPGRLFDTQIAAALLGFQPQMGYASLVKELFDVDVDKTHTRANWLRRPLPENYLQYAAEDVAWLLPAREELAERLEQNGRLAWAEEDSAQLLDASLYAIEPTQAIEKLKGARNLRGRRRAAAARLAAWRESEALRANRPRQWIAKDSALLDVASRLPENLSALNRIDGLPAGLIRRSGKAILAEVAASENDNSARRPPAAPSEAQKAQLKSAQKHVAKCASELGLAAETVASKRDLSAIVINGNRNSRVLSGWRRELLGDDLLKQL